MIVVPSFSGLLTSFPPPPHKTINGETFLSPTEVDVAA